MLGQLTGEDETDSGLDFSGRESGLLVVAAQFASFGSDTLEDIVDEGVHDAHGLLGDARLGVHLWERVREGGRPRRGSDGPAGAPTRLDSWEPQEPGVRAHRGSARSPTVCAPA